MGCCNSRLVHEVGDYLSIWRLLCNCSVFLVFQIADEVCSFMNCTVRKFADDSEAEQYYLRLGSSNAIGISFHVGSSSAIPSNYSIRMPKTTVPSYTVSTGTGL